MTDTGMGVQSQMSTTTLDGFSELTSPLERARAVMLCPGDAPPSTPLTVRNNALASEWLSWLRDTRGRQPSTVYNYASVVARFLDDCVGDRLLDQVTVEDVESWMLRPRVRRAQGRVGSPATRARNTAIIKSFYTYLAARGHVATNVGALLTAPTVRNRHPRAISDSVWLQAWDAADDELALTLGLGFFCGLRRVELATLGARHVDIARMQFTGFNRKGGGDDVFPFGEVLEVWRDFMPRLGGDRGIDGFSDLILKAAAAPPGSPGDPDRLLPLSSEDAVNRRLKAHLKAVGCEWFTPHALRHSFVTNLLRCSMPIELVSELANHSSITVTMRYVKIGGGRVAEWRAAKVNPRDWR